MSTLNVWLGVRTQDLPSWDDPENGHPRMADMSVVAPMFRADLQGNTTRQLRSVYVDDVAGWPGLLLQDFPQSRILGAWTQDGELVAPLSIRLVEYMPDDVTYDLESNETSRNRPSGPKQVNLGMGWADRRWIADEDEDV